jgi:hypothetical protein
VENANSLITKPRQSVAAVIRFKSITLCQKPLAEAMSHRISVAFVGGTICTWLRSIWESKQPKGGRRNDVANGRLFTN